MNINLEFKEVLNNIKDDEIYNIVPLYIADSKRVNIFELHEKINKDEEESEYNKYYHYLSKYVIKMSLPQDQLNDIKEHTGTDPYAYIRNDLINEVRHNIVRTTISKIYDLGERNLRNNYTKIDKFKNFLYKIFKKEYIKKTKVRSGENLSNILIKEFYQLKNGSCDSNNSDVSKFVIISPMIFSKFLQYPYTIIFHERSNQARTNLSTEDIYPIGKIHDITIYIDPCKEFNDTSIVMGVKSKEVNNIIKVIDSHSFECDTIKVVSTSAPYIQASYYHDTIEVIDNAEKNYKKLNLKLSKKLKN